MVKLALLRYELISLKAWAESLMILQVYQDRMLAASRVEHNEVKLLQKEVSFQQQRSRILAAKYKTLCLKRSAAGECDGKTESLVSF